MNERLMQHYQPFTLSRTLNWSDISWLTLNIWGNTGEKCNTATQHDFSEYNKDMGYL